MWDGESGNGRRGGPGSSGGGNGGGNGGGRPSASNNNTKIEQTQKQVNEVIDVMKDNVNRVLERGDKLADLDERADALQFGAHQFQATAKKVKRKYWWKNLKMWLIIGLIVIVLIIVIVLASIDWTKTSSGGSVTTAPAPSSPKP